MSSPTPLGSQKSNDPRLCIVKRDEKGYGLTVHGTKPVVVQSVRIDGAAWISGIREHDEILEVNDVSVENMTHNDVVSRIKENNVVKFKVITGSGRRHRNGAQRKRTTQISKTTTTTTSYQAVSEPMPTDPEKIREMCQHSNDTRQRMLKAAQDNLKEYQLQVKAQPDNVELRQRLDSSRQQVELLARLVEEPSGLRSVSESPLSSVSSSSVLSSSSSSSLRPWVSVHAQAASVKAPLPAFEVPSRDAPTELSHSKSCSMPEQSNAAVRPPARSKSDTQEKRRPVSMDMGQLCTPTVVTTPPTTPAPKSLKSLSQPQGIDRAGNDQSGSTTPEAISEELAPSHRRTSSLEVSPPSYTPKNKSPIVISDPEMDPDEEESRAAETEEKLFDSINKVLGSPSTCAKLISYAYTNSMTDEGQVHLHQILFIVVMLDFKNSLEHCVEKNDFQKDLRRIVYEIYSTFLAETAPLNVRLSNKLRKDLAERMTSYEYDSSTLKDFIKRADTEIRNETGLLTKFKKDLRNGMDNLMTQSVGTRRPLMPKEEQIREMENSLNKHVETVIKMPESVRRSAMVSAFATVYKYYQGIDASVQYKSMDNLALGSAVPFNSKVSKSKPMIPNLTRRGKVTYFSHSLSMKTIELEAYCEWCSQIICGAAPQAEVCHHCGIYFHKECRSNYKRNCDRSKRSSIFSFKQEKSKIRESFVGMSSEGREKMKKMGSREASGDQPSISASNSTASGKVRCLVDDYEKQSSPTPTTADEELPSRADSFETGLARSESLKTPNVSRPQMPAWRNKSDCSQHGDAISEAEHMQPASSSDSISVQSLSVPIDLENDVRQKIESDPVLGELPADVDQFMQVRGFRKYYDSLSDGNKRGNKDFKDYQIACCEMYFQELSQIRTLKIMQYMYVEHWPSGADDLKAAMGLDKLTQLIELREELIELLQMRLDGSRFTNMGAAYSEWLDETRSVQLKVLLGCIRYKGENHFDKLLNEKAKRVGAVLERTYNKLSIFDLMITITQHACRPSLHLNTVKKSLGKLQKAKSKRIDDYQQELDTWKAAESKLRDVADYLNELKQKVVDVIPKIDATKFQAPRLSSFRDIPRTLNCFYFLQSVDCVVKMQLDNKSKEARLLAFEAFCVFLYTDASNPDRFMLRSWERIPAILQYNTVVHVMKDNTTKKSFLIFLGNLVKEEESQSGQRSKSDMMGVLITVKADDNSVDALFTMFLNNKISTERRTGGNSMSSAHGYRQERSGSMQSMMPRTESFASQPRPLSTSEETSSISDAAVCVSDSNRKLLASLEDYKKDMMDRYKFTDSDYEQVVDVVENNEPRDNEELHLLLFRHLEQVAELMTDVGMRNVKEKTVREDEVVEKLKSLVSGLQTSVNSYAEPRPESVERTPVNSVFEEVIEDNRNRNVNCAPPSNETDEEETYEDVEQGPASNHDEETTKEMTSDEEELSDRVTYSMDDIDGDQVIAIAQRLVQQAFQVAMQRLGQERDEDIDISVQS